MHLYLLYLSFLFKRAFFFGGGGGGKKREKGQHRLEPSKIIIIFFVKIIFIYILINVLISKIIF